MKITQVRLGKLSVPLRVPFKTALRTVDHVEDIVVELHTDTGAVGYGEAPPTGPITGDTAGGIIGAVRELIAPAILGREVDDLESVTALVQNAGVHNTSAKAAVDMALWGPVRPAAPHPGAQAAGLVPAQPGHRSHHQRQPAPADGPGRPGRRGPGLRLPEGQGGGRPGPGHRPSGGGAPGGRGRSLHPDRRQPGLDPPAGGPHPERDAGPGPGPRAGGAARAPPGTWRACNTSHSTAGCR